ncbi:hypothetical protein INR49_000553 [Caranx melampygus]|nr:hypothetical protein INR49_000553 [Caranx melampygus]
MQRKEEVKCGGAAMSLPADLSCLQGGRGADTEASLSTLEKQLICPICLELFTKPVVILPCQHNLCRKCANELYQPSLFQARTTMMVNSGRFRCPSCRHEVVLDRHGVPAPLPPPPALPTCSDHEGEKVNIYCLTCLVPTCSLCKVFGAHQSCQVAPLTDIYQQQKDELSGEVSSLAAVNHKIQALIDELDESCRNIEAMTQQISSEQDGKTGHVQALVRCYGDSIEANTKLMERATSSMEETDMGAFVQNSRELITKVITATSSCPTETLKPGYENLSLYKFNFSRQERALKSIDFIKVIEEAPEPEVKPEPEEPKEPTEPKQHQKSSIQNLDSVVEPDKETVPALISPPVKPEQTAAAATADLMPAAPELLTDSVEADLQPETNNAGLSGEGSGQMKSRREEPKDKTVKETNICEHQEGMSTQQCEGGGAESDAGEWMAQRETEGKQDEDEKEVQMKEEADTTFYPSWYRAGTQCRLSPALMICSTSVVDGSLSEATAQAESDLQVQPQPAQSQDPQLPEWATSPSGPALCHPLPPLSTHLHAQPYFPPNDSHNSPPPHEALMSVLVQFTQQTAGRAGTQEGAEEDEDDVQDWVCLPGTVDKGLSLVEGSFDLGDGSLDFSDVSDATLTVPPEETTSGKDEDNFKRSDGRVEDAGERAQFEEDMLGLNKHDKYDYEAEMMYKGGVQPEDRGEMIRDDYSMLKDDAEAAQEDASMVKNDTLDAGDDGVESMHSLAQGGGDAVCAENKQEDVKNTEQPEDLNTTRRKGILKAVTLLFYLLAFLVILQRMEIESRGPAMSTPPLSPSSTSPSYSSLSKAPSRPSFCFSWLNPLQKKK